MTNQHRVFISYHHALDQSYKDDLLTFNSIFNVFVDYSVDTGDIDESLDDQTIRRKIRDEYLRDSTVTILLVGEETKKRKHVDWELYSSMHDGTVNKRSGILVVMLPTTQCTYPTAAHGETEKALLYPDYQTWVSLNRAEYERRYPYAPDRVIDNLVQDGVKISVAPWDRISHDAENLKLLLDLTHQNRLDCDYDLSRPMRRANS